MAVIILLIVLIFGDLGTDQFPVLVIEVILGATDYRGTRRELERKTNPASVSIFSGSALVKGLGLRVRLGLRPDLERSGVDRNHPVSLRYPPLLAEEGSSNNSSPVKERSPACQVGGVFFLPNLHRIGIRSGVR